jgi:hypothetical protein
MLRSSQTEPEKGNAVAQLGANGVKADHWIGAYVTRRGGARKCLRCASPNFCGLSDHATHIAFAR